MSHPPVRDVWVKEISEKRGAPYIYFDGQQALRTGFAPGQKFSVDVGADRITLTLNEDGSRTVSARERKDRVYPVIDLNSKELATIFDGMTSIRVVVTPGKIYLVPMASEVKKRERLNRLAGKLASKEPLAMGSLSHGGGILTHAIHQGLLNGGFQADLSFANEIREDLLMQAMEANETWTGQTMAVGMPMQEAAQDDWLLAQLPKLDILEMGLPCSGASRAGKSKRGLTKMEDHPDVGHLVFAALVILNKTQPAVVLLENVPEYADSASAQILRLQLRDMGYTTHEAVLEGKDFGCLENRVRWCMVATTHGMSFDFENLAPQVRIVKRLVSALDPEVGPEDSRWSRLQYLKDKEVRDKAAGKGFSMQTVTPESTSVPTIRKGYHKGGSTDPYLEHPTDPDLLRKFTAGEHAAIKEVPAHLIRGLSETTAHELLGQGIVYAPFLAVGERIAVAMIDLRNDLIAKGKISENGLVSAGATPTPASHSDGAPVLKRRAPMRRHGIG